MADVTERRAALAATRARIESRLDELVEHVPDRDELRASALKIGAAVVTVAAGVGLLVFVTRGRLRDRQARREGDSYAKALLTALPGLAEAYRQHADGSSRD